MKDTTYKFINFGDKFEHEGQTYTKCSYSRGFYHTGHKTIHKTFKKTTKVKTVKGNFYDVEK